MLAKIGFSLFGTWSSIRKYVCMGDFGLFTKFRGSFRFLRGIAVVPLKLEAGVESKRTIRENSSPNSAWSVRPVYLIRAKEDEEWIHENVVPITDRCRKSLQHESCIIAGDDGKVVDVSFKIYDTMKDLKVKKDLAGKGGAHCLLCNFTQKD